MFHEQSALRLGLFVLGCAPAGSSSNFWAIILDGDLDLSITMSFISTVAAIGKLIRFKFINYILIS